MTTESSSLQPVVAILGGGGKAGRALVAEVLRAGYRARLLLRHPAVFPLADDRLTIVPGDARDPAALGQLLTPDCRALLSTLGHPRGEATPILAGVTERLLPLLAAVGIGRYVVVTSLYDTGQMQTDAATGQAATYMDQHFPAFMADRRRELALLQASPLAWTAVRLPLLVEGPPTGRVAASLDHLPGTQITTADLGRFLVAQLASEAYVGLAPFVAESRVLDC